MRGVRRTLPCMNVIDLHRALDHEKFTACFQPIVEISTGLITGFEVLARWRHPDLGLILPSNFISLAEDNDLTGELMRQVFRAAFAAASDLPAPLSLSLNVSPIQMEDLSLPERIQDAASESSFPLDRVTIEITESSLLNNLARARTIVYKLKELGCWLSLDDFGTGYSSLGHLHTLPFDELKIDRSFVSSMMKSKESRKIVAAIIGLGHSLDLVTVAEGIETEDQAEMLLRLGCSRGQGWLYGRPAPQDEIYDLIAMPPRQMPCLAEASDLNHAIVNLEAMPAQRLSQLQAIYDGSPVGLAFLDRNLRYLSINRRLAKMNGASVMAHLGRTVQDMIPTSFPALEPYLRRALLGEPIADVEVTRPGNLPGWPDWTALLSYQPAFDEANEVIGVSIAVSDTTELNRIRKASPTGHLTAA